ncbi:MAG: Hsp20/alpha crystallin family protein [Lentisphaeria bacterium]|nr:Hsp20/alpha crystallin family protein [Lentisphaeria bacterium]
MSMLTRNERDVEQIEVPKTFSDMMKNFFSGYPEFHSPWIASAKNGKLDVEVHEKDVTVTFPFPGAQAKDFNVEVVGDFITVKAHRESTCNEEKEKHYIRRERSRESYEETLHLPVAVQGGDTKAKYADGVLTVIIPRLEKDVKAPRNIEVE